MTQIICFSGLSASGKSTISKLLAKEWVAEYISVGDLVRELAKSKGFSKGRELFAHENIETIGNFVSNKLINFCNLKNRIVIDGVYSPKIIVVLEKYFPKQILTFNVRTTRHARLAFYKRRLLKSKIIEPSIKKKIHLEDLSKALVGVHQVARLPETINIQNIHSIQELKNGILKHVQKKFP